MSDRLQTAELKVMAVLWREGDCTARHIAAQLRQELGWNVNTTYTLIRRCIQKGAIARTEPGFLCHALVEQAQVQRQETAALIDKVYDGSVDKLFAALLGSGSLSQDQIARLRQLVDELE